MKEFFGKFVVGSLPGIAASVIAITATWFFFDAYTEENKRPCAQRPCFAQVTTRVEQLEARMAKVEAGQHPSTSKRFNSDDALAMELRMIKCHNRDDWKTCLLEERLKYEKSRK